VVSAVRQLVRSSVHLPTAAVESQTVLPLPVVIVHYRAPEWLSESVSSVLASDIDVAVTVVSNGGTLPPLPEAVNAIVNRDNLGYAGGANVGLRLWLRESSPYCVVASHDLVSRPGTLRRLVEVAEEHDTYGAVAPNLPQRRVDEAGGLVGRAFITGSCMLLRRTCVDQVGLFDEDFGSYYEDYDLCLRMRAAGWHVGIVADAVASSHGTAHAPRARRLSFANQVLLAGKHRGRWAATKRFTAMLVYAPRDFARAVADRGNRSDHLIRGTARIRAVPRALGFLAKSFRRHPSA
jgi:N-acetylglucosaminyl-diphospho-decaprenol L-rhamnosyltransferase